LRKIVAPDHRTPPGPAQDRRCRSASTTASPAARGATASRCAAWRPSGAGGAASGCSSSRAASSGTRLTLWRSASATSATREALARPAGSSPAAPPAAAAGRFACLLMRPWHPPPRSFRMFGPFDSIAFSADCGSTAAAFIQDDKFDSCIFDGGDAIPRVRAECAQLLAGAWIRSQQTPGAAAAGLLPRQVQDQAGRPAAGSAQAAARVRPGRGACGLRRLPRRRQPAAAGSVGSAAADAARAARSELAMHDGCDLHGED
jgi:hypothetical protein